MPTVENVKSVRPVGRPARVNLDAIFAAALEIGLDKVTMTAVADQLGTGVSTLYKYVRNRDELVRLSALNQAMLRRPPRHAAQHWAEVAMRYAEDLLQTSIDEPQVIIELMRGWLGPRTEVETLERFLSELRQYGFTPKESFHVYRSLAVVALGAAVGALNYASARRRGYPHEDEVRDVLAEYDADELPLTRAAADEYARDDIQLWFQPLRELITGIATLRNETLPPDFFDHLNSTLAIKTTSTLSKADNSLTGEDTKNYPRSRRK